MGHLNYKNMGSKEFEALAKDVCERMLDRKLERFGEGKDGGIDLTDDVVNPTIIVQCKRYENSSQAVDVFEKEAVKMEKFKGSLREYYAFTSADLKPQQVDAIRGFFGEFMDSDDHVIYNEKIEDFFNERRNFDLLEKNMRAFVSLPEWYYKKDILDKYSFELTVSVIDGQFGLTGEAIGKLKDYFRSYEDLKNRDIDIRLTFPNFDDMARIMVREKLVREYDEDFAFNYARQELSSRIKSWRAILELAIKYLLQYSRKTGLAPMYNVTFFEKYGAKDFVYKDEFGVESFYTDVYFWVTIANQMINDRLTLRLSGMSGLDSGYCSILLWRNFRKKPLEFKTLAPDRCKNVDFINVSDALFTMLDQKIQLYYVLPAVYFEVAKFSVFKGEKKEHLSEAEIISLVDPNKYFVGMG